MVKQQPVIFAVGTPDRQDVQVRVVRQERITGRRYNLHPGDRLGRLQVIDIREREISFLIDDFGIERRETLSLRKSREEQTP